MYPELKKNKGPRSGPFVFFGAPGEIDQNSLGAVLTLRAPAASKTLARFVELESSPSSGHTTNKKGAPVGPLFHLWRARRDSNSRPPGS